jgi:hypothetical protein
MKIVVNHLTRMRGERICVAGVDWEMAEHVRPVTSATSPLTRELLRSNGGIFEVGALVDLGPVAACGHPPETEDHRFSPSSASYESTLAGDQYLELLNIVSSESLEEGFGPDLERASKWKYAVPVGRGARSLAVIRPSVRSRLTVDDSFERPRVVLEFRDVEPQTYVPVTDLRFYAADQVTILRDVVESVDSRLRRGVDAFIMFGLGRPWERDPDHHWLQVNGICLADQPVGDVP